MKDAIGRELGVGDLLIYSPRDSYSTHIAIVVNPETGLILSGRANSQGSVYVNHKTGKASSERLFIIARRFETDDYEEINDKFVEKLIEMKLYEPAN